MAVIVSDSLNGSYNGKLSTTNGFYRAEAYNFSPNSATQLPLSSTRTINVTFANAGNITGMVIGLEGGAANAYSLVKGTVTLTLKQSGTIIDTASLTTAQIIGQSTSNISDNSAWLPKFTFATKPAVTTSAGVYTIEITNSGAQTTNWNILTSDGTNPFYVVWCNNQVTASSSNDTLVIADPITVDTSFTTKAVLGTGDTTNGSSIILCTQQDGTVANVANLKWISPAASYTLTVDGLLIVSGHSGIRMGTSGSRIPFAQQAILLFNATPSVGTVKGIKTIIISNINVGRGSIQLYGEIPSEPLMTINADAAAAQKNIVLTSSPSTWQIGDRLLIPKIASNGQQTALYVISSISGPNITLVSNIPVKIYAGSPVINVERYGCKLTASTTATVNHTFQCADNLTIDGVLIEYNTFSLKTQSGQWVDEDQANMSQYQFKNMVYLVSSAGIGSNLLGGFEVPSMGVSIDKLYSQGSINASGYSFTLQGALGYANASGVISITNSISGGCTSSNSLNLIGLNTIFTGNKMFCGNGNHTNGQSLLRVINAINCTFTNNYFFSSTQAVSMESVYGFISWGGNYFNNCQQGGYYLMGVTKGIISTGDYFGNEVANSTTDISFIQNCVNDFELATPMTNVNVETLFQKNWVDGLAFRITNKNNVTNDDSIYRKYGFYQRTGYGLSDTTVWNGTSFTSASAGQFGLRMQPNDGTNVLVYQDNSGATTIGNCQGLPVTVTIRVKLNNAAYYAGTNILPRLRVTYDGSTQITSQATATTSAQQVQVTFTPTTTNQSITIQIEGATDATSTNAFFYVGELLTQLPSGISTDTTRFGSWTHALPLGTFRTFPAPASTWDEPLNIHTITGSAGAAQTSTNNNAGLIPVLL